MRINQNLNVCPAVSGSRRYPITTGIQYFFSDRIPEICFTAVLTEDIQKTILQQALGHLLEYMPCFRVRLALSDGDLILEESPEPFSVHESSRQVHISDIRTGSALFTVSFSGNTIRACFHHGLTDGMGTMRFSVELVRTYLSLAHPELPPTDRTPSAAAADVYADPYGFAAAPPHRFSFEKGPYFMFDPDDVDEGRGYFVHTSLRRILEISKNSESNVSSVLSLCMAHVINAYRPGSSPDIGISCPVDIRKMLGCPNNLQNVHTSIRYVYSDRLSRLPMSQQLSCFKGMMMLQTSQEYLMPKFFQKKKAFDELCREKHTFADKLPAFRNKLADHLPIVSYMGSVSFGEYDSCVQSCRFSTLAFGTTGMNILSSCFGDDFVIYLGVTLKNKAACLQQFITAMRELGIPCTAEEANE